MASQILQGSFTSGELTPDLEARTDFARYGSGCRTLKNFWVQAHGGASKRPGFNLVGTLPGEARLLPFVFNAEQSYCLVFGDGWLRVCTEEGFILDDEGEVLQIESPYNLEQARNLGWAQSGDILFLACRGVWPQQLRRLGHSQWEFEPMSFLPDVDAPEWDPLDMEYELVPSYALTYYGGTCTDALGRKINDDLYIRTNTQQPVNVDGYAMFYNRATNSAGQISPAVLNTRYTYYVTAVSEESGRESPISLANNITGPASNNWQVGDFIRIRWHPVENASEYRIYKSESGNAAGLLATTSALYFDDTNILANYNRGLRITSNPFEPKEGEEELGKEFPGVVCFFEQRLVYGSSTNQPQTLWFSDTGDYQTFSRHTPIQADDSIEISIASNEVSPMQWLVPMRSLMAGGTGMEWEITSSDGGAFSAGNARAIPHTRRGSSALRALVIGSTILHVTRSAREIRNFQYDFGTDAFTGQEKTILASHLFEKYRIVDWDYQALPHSIIWVVREDGVLLGLTYNAEQEVYAWHRHETRGSFRSVCSVVCANNDKLFSVVERNGLYCVECMAEPFIPDTDGDSTAGCGVYLDSSLAFSSNEAVSRIHGLEHLEGQEIMVWADGMVYGMTVENGLAELPSPARNIVAGLSYSAELETMPLAPETAAGSSSAKKKKVPAINIHFKNSLGAEAGTDFLHLERIKWPERNGIPVMYSGLQRVVTGALAQNLISACIRSNDPYPLTVLAVIPEISVY